MPLGLYDISIPPFIRGLKTLSAILEKGRLHASSTSTSSSSSDSESALIDTRLIADMGSLAYQIQRISDTSKGCAVRAGKAAPVAMEDSEKTFPELQARIAKTIEVLEGVDPKTMDAMEDEEIVMKTGGGEIKFKGRDYVLVYAVPNYYFHLCMAYAILRKEGVQVGKKDYLGRP